MADSAYDRAFYESIAGGSRSSAQVIVPLLIELVGRPASVVDVGCGVGAWLSVLEEAGVADYLGIDGDYISRDQLQIPAERFRAADLTCPLSIERRFDLVICLEVAEHLPAVSAETLVSTLTSLGDVILFSAAIPFQGGQDHVNEQWPSYWADRFRDHGFVTLDPFRRPLWDDDRVEPWLRQNMVLHVSEAVARRPSLRATIDGATPVPALVHPRLYLRKARAAARYERLVANPLTRPARVVWRAVGGGRH